jgi:hypothetical protein
VRSTTTASEWVAREQLAEVLRRSLGDAIDVFRHGDHIFGDPGRRLAGRRRQRIAEHARGAGKDEGCDFIGGRRFKQVQRARDVDVDKILAAVGRYMRLVQGCGV